MAGRRALYVLPSFAVLATTALVLGPGRERPALGARVWGIPAEGVNVAAWRIETIERQFGVDRAVAADPLQVSVHLAGRRIAAWTGRSGDDGVAEAFIRSDEPLTGPFEVRIESGRMLLGSGTLPQRPTPPLALEKRVAEGTSAGPVTLAVEIERGVLAAPFPGSVRVIAKRNGAPVEGVILTPTASGADIPLTGKQITTDASGEATFNILPQWHAVDLKIEAVDRRAEGEPKSTWEGGLPVHPGALYLDLERPVAHILSPVPRERAYLSAIGSQGRVHGAIVGLARNERGLYQGALDLTELTKLGAEAVTLSGDPEEVGSGTVAWPLASMWGVASPPRAERLYDGVPFAERREKERATRARLAAVGVALFTAVIEAILLVLYSRESQRRLAAHLAQLGEGESERAAASRIVAAPASRALMLLVAVGLVLLAFGVVAAFAIVH